MPEEAPAGAKVVTLEQLAIIFEKHFAAVAHGLAATNPMLPPEVAWGCMATAMGRVLSKATMGPDITTTLQARNNACKIVSDAIKQAYPSFDGRGISLNQAANANGLLRQ